MHKMAVTKATWDYLLRNESSKHLRLVQKILEQKRSHFTYVPDTTLPVKGMSLILFDLQSDVTCT